MSLFETTIRIVGGFLSAYDLTGDALFLEKAQEIVERGLPYFGGSTTGRASNIWVLVVMETCCRTYDLVRIKKSPIFVWQQGFLRCIWVQPHSHGLSA